MFCSVQGHIGISGVRTLVYNKWNVITLIMRPLRGVYRGHLGDKYHVLIF
jgi:hypothetical protein